MGIYIPGLEMPQFGGCIVITSDGVASKYLDGDVAIYYAARPDKASAVELPPHGRLGDLDAFLAKLKKDPLFPLVEQYGMSGVIEAQPTIIPAEEGEI